MISENVTFESKNDLDLADPSSPAREVICKFLFPRLTDAGAKSAYYGQFIEKPKTVILIVNWSSIDDYENFKKTPYVILAEADEAILRMPFLGTTPLILAIFSPSSTTSLL